MPYFTRPFALFLLCLLVRVLVPDTLVLALHQHQHTTEKRLDNKFGKEQLDIKHIHCQTDHLFNSSYYNLPLPIALPVGCSFVISYEFSRPTVWQFTFPNNICLRGPPQMV